MSVNYRSEAAHRATKSAKKLLTHYFKLLAEKVDARLDSDCIHEIEDVVDCIVLAAVAEGEAQNKEKP